LLEAWIGFDPTRFNRYLPHIIGRHRYTPFGWGGRICACAAFALQEACAIPAILVRPPSLELRSGCVALEANFHGSELIL
jgi:cytochrome P450